MERRLFLTAMGNSQFTITNQSINQSTLFDDSITLYSRYAIIIVEEIQGMFLNLQFSMLYTSTVT